MAVRSCTLVLDFSNYWLSNEYSQGFFKHVYCVTRRATSSYTLGDIRPELKGKEAALATRGRLNCWISKGTGAQRGGSKASPKCIRDSSTGCLRCSFHHVHTRFTMSAPFAIIKLLETAEVLMARPRETPLVNSPP